MKEETIMNIGRTLVRGNRGLAGVLGVHHCTVQEWRRDGVLDDATVCDRGRVIIYDLDKVLECLKGKPLKPGRPRVRKRGE